MSWNGGGRGVVLLAKARRESARRFKCILLQLHDLVLIEVASRRLNKGPFVLLPRYPVEWLC